MSFAATTLSAGGSAEQVLRPSRRLLTVLVLIAFFGMTLSSYAAMTRPLKYHARDEGPNASYAIRLYEGTLPTINTPVPQSADEAKRYPQIASAAARQEHQRHKLIWTANHPPLYYLLGVPLVALANATHTPALLIIGMRLISAIAYGITLLLIGLIAFEVTPRRPAAAVLATAVAASCAVLAGSAGFISNDSVAVVGSSLTVLATLRILRLGVTRNRLLITALAGAAAAATKAPGVITVIMCGAALLVTLALRDRTLKGLLKAVGTSAVASGVPGLVIGWFYVRNIVLYGDPTASAALLHRYQRSPIGSWWDVMSAPRFWHGWFDSIWVPEELKATFVHWVVDGLIVIALLGLVLGIAARIRDHLRPPEPEPTQLPVLVPVATSERGHTPFRALSTPSVAMVGLLALIAHAVVILVNLAQFRSGGGNPHERYLMTVVPLTAIVLAIGMLAIVGAVPLGEVRRREEVATAVMTALLLVFAVLMFWAEFPENLDISWLMPLRPVAYGMVALGGAAGAGAVVAVLWPREQAENTIELVRGGLVEPGVRLIGPRSGERVDAADDLVRS